MTAALGATSWCAKSKQDSLRLHNSYKNMVYGHIWRMKVYLTREWKLTTWPDSKWTTAEVAVEFTEKLALVSTSSLLWSKRIRMSTEHTNSFNNDQGEQCLMLLCVGNWQLKQSRLMSNIHSNTTASCKQVCSQKHACRLLNPGQDFLLLFLLCLSLLMKIQNKKLGVINVISI